MNWSKHEHFSFRLAFLWGYRLDWPGVHTMSRCNLFNAGLSFGEKRSLLLNKEDLWRRRFTNIWTPRYQYGVTWRQNTPKNIHLFLKGYTEWHWVPIISLNVNKISHDSWFWFLNSKICIGTKNPIFKRKRTQKRRFYIGMIHFIIFAHFKMI